MSACEMCGATPAAPTTSRRHLGLVVYGRTTTTSGLLCRTHARSQISGDLVKTLVLGWWGVFSFFINLIVVPMQIVALVNAGRRDPERHVVPRSATAVESA